MKRILLGVSALVTVALLGAPGTATAADRPGAKSAQHMQITEFSARRRRRRWRRGRWRRRAYWGRYRRYPYYPYYPYPYYYYPGPRVFFSPFGFGFGW